MTNYRDWFVDENDFMHPSQRGYRAVKGGRTPVLAGPTPLANARSLTVACLGGRITPEQADKSLELMMEFYEELRAYQSKRGIPLTTNPYKK